MLRALCVASSVMMAFLFAARSVQADYRYVFDQTNYTVNPGGTVAVNVCLQETGTTVLKEGMGAGLAGAGVKVVFDDPPLPSSPAKVLSTSAIITNTSAFPEVWGRSVSADMYARLLLGAGFDPDTSDPINVYGVETPPGSGTYRASLGTFMFTAGAVAGEVTNIRATDYGSTSDTITGDLVVLDNLIAPVTATITTIPEPSGLVLIGMATLAVFAFRYFRGVASISACVSTTRGDFSRIIRQDPFAGGFANRFRSRKPLFLLAAGSGGESDQLPLVARSS